MLSRYQVVHRLSFLLSVRISESRRSPSFTDSRKTIRKYIEKISTRTSRKFHKLENASSRLIIISLCISNHADRSCCTRARVISFAHLEGGEREPLELPGGDRRRTRPRSSGALYNASRGILRLRYIRRVSISNGRGKYPPTREGQDRISEVVAPHRFLRERARENSIFPSQPWSGRVCLHIYEYTF